MFRCKLLACGRNVEYKGELHGMRGENSTVSKQLCKLDLLDTENMKILALFVQHVPAINWIQNHPPKIAGKVEPSYDHLSFWHLHVGTLESSSTQIRCHSSLVPIMDEVT